MADGDGDGYGNNQSEGANLIDAFPKMPLSGMILMEMDMETIATVQKEINSPMTHFDGKILTTTE